MRSFVNCKVGLFAVVLAAGSSSALLELQAAPSGPDRIVASAMTVTAPDFSAEAHISGDAGGTALVIVNIQLPNGNFMGGFVFGTTNWSMSNDLMPGMSGKGSFSGSGQTVIDGSILDPLTGQFTPVVLGVDMSVTDADQVSTYFRQGIEPVLDFITGETSLIKSRKVGRQAVGATAGTLLITADGVLVVDTTGGPGSLESFTSHEVVRLD